MSVTSDYFLTVKVRAYGGVTADEAAEAMRNHPETFTLYGGREVEILDAQVLSVTLNATMGAAPGAHNIAVYTANG